MRRLVITALVLFSGLKLFACGSTSNNLFPILQLTVSPLPCFESCAYALYGEIGNKNFRGGASIGAYISPSQRFKISGDYLAQNLKYNFYTGEQRAWDSQYSIGTEYQIIMPNWRFMSLDFGIACSHASDSHLKSIRLTRRFELKRRISGSNNGYGFLGATSEVWCGGLLSAAFTYDYVRYHRHFEDKKRKIGVGGSVAFSQKFLSYFEFDAEAQFRAPYNYYMASLNWNPCWFDSFGMTVGLFGSYTRGKSGVAKVAAGGIQLSFSLGSECCKSAWFNDLFSNEEEYGSAYGDITAWTAKPAAYVPVVLTVRDEWVQKKHRRHH